MRTPLLLLCLLWSLLEVHSLIVPYVSFMGGTLLNHAYVNFSLVGSDLSGSDSVQCHTDLDTCCNRDYDDHHGDWIPPGREERLPLSGNNNESDVNIYEVRVKKRVDLRRGNNAEMPSGIYRCDIPTNAVHEDNDTSVRESVYVGLYTDGGTCHNIINLQ